MNEKKQRTELIAKLKNEEGTVEQAELWLNELKALDASFSDSDAMLYLETNVLARKEYEALLQKLGKTLTREQLRSIVAHLIANIDTDEQQLAWLRLIRNNTSHPRITELLYDREPPLTAEEIVEELISYRPIIV